jgi:hypothetical protein
VEPLNCSCATKSTSASSESETSSPATIPLTLSRPGRGCGGRRGGSDLADERRARGVLFRWTLDRPAPGVGIPYVDYKRGDGVHIGPGTAHPWTPVLIDGRNVVGPRLQRN